MPQGRASSDLPEPWPLHAPLQTRTGEAPFNKDSRLYNGYAEYDPELRTYQIFKRVGLGPPALTGSGTTGNGIYTGAGTNLIFNVAGSSLSVNPSPLGVGITYGLATVDPNHGPYSFETIQSDPLITRTSTVVLNNGQVAYYVNTGFTGGPIPIPFANLTFISDPNFPYPHAPGWAFVDGWLFVMDTLGNIVQSATQGQAANWSGTAIIKANNYADTAVCLTRQLNYVIALKQYSTQVFYDAGNPSPLSTLSPVPDAQIPLGCLAASSVQSIDNSLLWLTSNQTISPQVVQMDNLVPTIVSTPAVDRILDNVEWDTNTAWSANLSARGWVLKHGGHRFYGLTLINNNITLVYDLDQKLWYIWTDAQGNYWPVVGTAFSPPINNQPGIHYAQHATNGRVYPVDGDYSFPNDNGTLFPVDIYTPNYTAGTSRRKMLNMIYFDADQVDGSELQCRYSDDDYQSWSNFRTVDLSVAKPRLDKEGTFHFRRAYHFRHMSNTTLRIRAMYPAIDIGTL